MSAIDPQHLHRTVKLEMDEGRARSQEHAAEIARARVLQIVIGGDVATSPTRQTMLLTAVNAARRAFLGGVHVHGASDAVTTINWGYGRSIADAVEYYGGTLVKAITTEAPTIVIGSVTENPSGSVVIWPTWESWSGGVVARSDERLPEVTEFSLAGILASGVAVSEAFQHVRDYAPAGRRSVGLSLWRPDLPWQDQRAYGPRCRSLPVSFWLIGLGHLGQAYAWAIGSLPYAENEEAHLMLQDFDVVAEANDSTGILCTSEDIGTLKTRVVAGRLEQLGFTTRITERKFDRATKRSRSPEESDVPADPGIALGGLDHPGPRHVLESADFDLVVDGGLGGGWQTYLEIDVHTFPSALHAADVWPAERLARTPESITQPAYDALRDRLIEAGAGQRGGHSVRSSPARRPVGRRRVRRMRSRSNRAVGAATDVCVREAPPGHQPVAPQPTARRRGRE